MDSLKQWALCLTVAAAAGTLVMALSPRGSMDKTIRAVVGIFVVAVIGAPFADMLKSSYSAEVFAAFNYAEEGEDMREFVVDSFCKTAETELKNIADEMGITIEKVYIKADINAENCIIIHSVSVETAPEFSEKADEISKILSEKTGVEVTVIAE